MGMLKVKRRGFERAVLRVVEFRKIEELTNGFSLQRVFFYSLLKDISAGKGSPNFHILRKIARDKGVSEQFIIDRAERVLSYLSADEQEQNRLRRLPALPIVVEADPLPFAVSFFGTPLRGLRMSLERGLAVVIASGKLILLFLLALIISAGVFYLMKSGFLFPRNGEKIGLPKKGMQTEVSDAPIHVLGEKKGDAGDAKGQHLAKAEKRQGRVVPLHFPSTGKREIFPP